jgi:hypothetical protein
MHDCGKNMGRCDSGRSSAGLAQHFPYLPGKHLQGEWLLQERGVGIDHTLMYDGIFRLPLKVYHLGLQTRLAYLCG